MPLLPYQEEPCKKLIKALLEKGSALDASDTGTGKTYCAVHVAKSLDLPTGIICPKSVIPSWERVCKAEGLKPAFIINYEKLKTGKHDWLVRNGREFEWNFGGLLIWDEVHRCKSMSSINAKMLTSAWKTKMLRCLCLSATAARNPVEMRALGHVLGLHKGYDFFHWVFKNGAKKNRWNGIEWRGTNEQLQEIHKQIFTDRGVRVRVKDLGDAFPENQILAEALDIDPEIGKVYEDAKLELDKLKEKEDNDFPSAMTIILRARQRVEILKVPTLIEMTEDFLDEGRSVVVFVNFNATLDLLANHFKTDCIIKHQDANERIKNLDKFQNNESRIIICNIQAGGVGISLHDLDGGYPRVALICPTYNAVDLRQALGRIHRSGGKSKCLQKVIYAAGTVEEKVCKRVEQKLDAIDMLNDNEVSDELTWNQT